jgi:hypothetical protein
VRVPLLLEPLAIAADEATTILALSKARKVQHHSFQNKCRERNNSKLPFTIDDPEGFGIFFGIGDFLGNFSGGVGMEASPSNKSSARAKAWVSSLLPMEVEDVFFQQSLCLWKKFSR